MPGVDALDVPELNNEVTRSKKLMPARVVEMVVAAGMKWGTGCLGGVVQLEFPAGWWRFRVSEQLFHTNPVWFSGELGWGRVASVKEKRRHLPAETRSTEKIFKKVE